MVREGGARNGSGSGAWLSLLFVFVAIGSSLGRADLRPLTLYEKAGRAPLVVWGEVADGEHRFAVIRTLAVVKCEIPERPGGAFRIAFRLDSFLRRPWEDKIEFATGERLLLFLRKFTKEDGEEPEGDVYTLLWGAQGRTLLPAEGEEAFVEAVRSFTQIAAEPDPDSQARRLREAVSSRNPLISDAAFVEVIKQGLGDLEMIPDVVAFFGSPREPARLQAMRLLRQIVTDAQTAGRQVPDRQDLADRVRGSVAADSSEQFRVEGVRTLHVLGGADARAFLQRLAREDPSQLVRYEAEKSLLGWHESP